MLQLFIEVRPTVGPEPAAGFLLRVVHPAPAAV
jgi:hypothetical protein